MTKEQFLKEKKRLEEQYNLDLYMLRRKYAIENNSYKKGDIVSDERKSIIIQSVCFLDRTIANQDGCCYYIGKRIKKDGSLYLDNRDNKIYQDDII